LIYALSFGWVTAYSALNIFVALQQTNTEFSLFGKLHRIFLLGKASVEGFGICPANPTFPFHAPEF
jgi:hypothetical protein